MKPNGDDILTDKEVAAMFHISVDALQRRMRRGFREGEIDLRLALPGVVCRKRWWLKSRLLALMEKSGVAR